MSDREGSPELHENGEHEKERDSRGGSGDEGRGRRSPTPRSSRSGSYAHSKHRSFSRSRSRSRKRHYYRSHSRSPQYQDDYSRSRSRSYSPRHRGGYGYGKKNYGRSRSRSPMSRRRRHVGNREEPLPSRCIGVFGLSLYTEEKELRQVFSKYGPVEEVTIVYDAQSGRSRGFAFVYFEDLEDAKMAKERCNGIDIDGRKIRVDYSITQRPHTPTPGVYMGKPTYPRYGGGGGGRGGGRGGGSYYKEHSPSPYYSRNKRYSRSRSYSPRSSKYDGYY